MTDELPASIPWYQSRIIQQQVAAAIVTILGLLKVTSEIDINATVATVFAAIAALIPIWTIITRLRRPSPPITGTALADAAALKGPLP